MNVVAGKPPNFDMIVARFPAARRPGTIFTWGDTVYVNGAPELNSQLKAHEAVHMDQQRRAGGPERWWIRYLEDSAFRLEQELSAHRAEYRTLKNLDRDAAVRSLQFIAERLASPLYGGIVSVREAKRLILS